MNNSDIWVIIYLFISRSSVNRIDNKREETNHISFKDLYMDMISLSKFTWYSSK